MELKENKTYFIHLSNGFAMHNKLPVYFEAVPLKQTPKAVYLYGTGTLRTKTIGNCMICGRTLTHPVSKALGIGPICGGHYYNWDAVGGYTKENISRLSKEIETTIIIDSWVPKATIVSAEKIDRKIELPFDHKMATRNSKEEESRKAVLNKKGKIIITFPFNRDDLEKVKTLTGRRFNKEGGPHWTTPFCKENVELLKEWDFKIDPALEENYQKHFGITIETTNEIEIPGLIGPGLFPFQKQGVSFIECRNGNAIIGDSMGLGKTAQALAYLQLHPEKRPAVIVVPASLKLNWAKECNMWLPNPNYQIINGKDFQNIKLNAEIYIINYDIFANKYETYIDKKSGKRRKREIKRTGWVDYLIKIDPQILIIDEVHFVKSTTAARTKSIKKLAKVCPHVLALSGTPIVNRPVEFFNAINLVEPGLFPSFWKFAMRFCDAKHNGYGWDFNGASHIEELHEQLQSIMIRRKKEDVLKDLPTKIRSVVPLELTKKMTQEYQRASEDILSWIRENEGAEKAEKASQAEVLTAINKLKQLSTQGKINACVEWIKNFLEIDGKLVVFAENHWAIDRLMTEFGNIAVKLDGRDSQPTREKAVEKFQNDEKIRLFVGQFVAAGVGITLTAASNTCFVQLPWSPGIAQQAEDRVHRIGQEAGSVNAYYLIAQGTIEETIANLLDKKAKVLDAILDGKETNQASLLTELLKELKTVKEN